LPLTKTFGWEQDGRFRVQQKGKKMIDFWCASCPLQGRGLCPETPEYIEGCKKFSEKMRNQSSNRKVKK